MDVRGSHVHTKYALSLSTISAAALLLAIFPAFAGDALAEPPAPAPATSDVPKIVVPRRTTGAQQMVVYTMALSDDRAANARLTAELAYRLRIQRSIKNSFIVPMPTWSLKDYLAECKTAQKSTRGAVIVLPPSVGSATESKFIYTESWTRTIFALMVAECGDKRANPEDEPLPTPTPRPSLSELFNPKPPEEPTLTVTWVSNTYAGTGVRYSATLLPLAVLAALYQTFAPTRSIQSKTTTVFPVPSPIPAGGARQAVETTSAVTANASGAANITTALFGVFGGNSLIIGSPSAPDPQFQYAIGAAMEQFADDMVRVCNGELKDPVSPLRDVPPSSVALLDRAHTESPAPSPSVSPPIQTSHITLKGTKVYGLGKAFASRLTELPPIDRKGVAFCDW